VNAVLFRTRKNVTKTQTEALLIASELRHAAAELEACFSARGGAASLELAGCGAAGGKGKPAERRGRKATGLQRCKAPCQRGCRPAAFVVAQRRTFSFIRALDT
jgi:hypothetical protein